MCFKMEKQGIYRYFAKLYFLRLAEEKNVTSHYFAKYRKNNVYLDYFKMVKLLDFLGEKGKADNEKQRRRAYELFKYAELKFTSLQDGLDEALRYATETNSILHFNNVIAVLGLQNRLKSHSNVNEVIQPKTNIETDIENDFNGNLLDATITSADVEMLTSFVFGNGCENLSQVSKNLDETLPHLNSATTIETNLLDTPIFNENVDLCSTKQNEVSSFNITNNEETLIDEYIPLRKKIKYNVSKQPNKRVKIQQKQYFKFSNKKPCLYSYYINELKLTDKEEFQIKSNLISAEDQKDLTSYLEDIIREKFKILNNVCPLNYNSSRWNRKNMLVLYANCIYYEEGCCKYKFCAILVNSPFKVHVYATNNQIQHPNVLKKHQLRGIGRVVARREIKHVKATKWRDNQLCFQSNYLKRIGNNQKLLSKAAARKLKAEEMRCLDYDKDPYIDVCKMSAKKNWEDFIQNGKIKADIYLFTKKQLQILHMKNKTILKLSRNTLFFDATGSVVRKFHEESKRVFLYSLVAHIRHSNESGILLPIAEGILCSHFTNDVKRFLLFVETYCNSNGIAWPIAPRICTDWSLVLINSVLSVFNSQNEATRLDKYIFACYNSSQSNTKPNMVIIQICCAHFMRIVSKDVDAQYRDEEPKNFFKWQLWCAVNIGNFNEFFNWLTCMITIISNRYKTTDVKKALLVLKSSHELDTVLISEHSAAIECQEDSFKAQYAKSPFYTEAFKIYNKIKSNINTSCEINPYFSEEFCDILLKKYAAYAPLWSNLMGIFVDKTNTRISNSPVESYYNNLKHNTLNSDRHIRPSTYVREAKVYVRAKLAEAEEYLKLTEFDEPVKVKTIKQEEETWRRTPKKVKRIMNSNGVFHMALNRVRQSVYSRQKYVFLKFKNIMDNIQCSLVDAPILQFSEFKSLDKKSELYANVIDLFISVMIYTSGEKAYTTSCGQGEQYFITQLVTDLDLPLNTHRHIFIPIFQPYHFTLVYLDTLEKHFVFLNPCGENVKDIEEKFNIFLKNTNVDKWTFVKLDHPIQTDNFNCGVFVCQFAEAILYKRELCKLENPNKYRDTIKEIFFTHADNMNEVCLHCGLQIIPPQNVCSDCDRPTCLGCVKHHYKKQTIVPFKCKFCTIALVENFT